MKRGSLLSSSPTHLRRRGAPAGAPAPAAGSRAMGGRAAAAGAARVAPGAAAGCCVRAPSACGRWVRRKHVRIVSSALRAILAGSEVEGCRSCGPHVNALRGWPRSLLPDAAGSFVQEHQECQLSLLPTARRCERGTCSGWAPAHLLAPESRSTNGCCSGTCCTARSVHAHLLAPESRSSSCDPSAVNMSDVTLSDSVASATGPAERTRQRTRPYARCFRGA